MKIRRNAKGKITISDMSPGDVRYLASAVHAMMVDHQQAADRGLLGGSVARKSVQERAVAAERLRNALFEVADRERAEITLTSGKADPADLWQRVEE